MRLAVRGVPKGTLRTHSAQQAPLWGSLVTCVVYCLRVPSVRALFLCFREYGIDSRSYRCNEWGTLVSMLKAA